MSVVIGIDPGSRFTGIGVLQCAGPDPVYLHHEVIRVPDGLEFAARLFHIAGELNRVFDHFKPQQTVVERIFLGKNADSAFKLGHARGVILMTAAAHGSQVFEYAARSVKKSVAGSGAATKEHVAMVVSRLLGVRTELPLDAADALSMAICHSRGMQLEKLMSQQRRRLNLEGEI